MNELYPLKFHPIFKEKIWGGEKIKNIIGLNPDPITNCGEAWVLSGVEGENTLIANGYLQGSELYEAIEIYMDELVGEKCFEAFATHFPVLVKLIDANDYLSLQVHPDDEKAMKNHGVPQGKSEMWYILQAENNAELINGFLKKMDKDEFLKHLKNKTLKDILNIEKVKEGDVFDIPAGRIHALCKGILLAEVQQTSDYTYRVYDWDRLDSKGNSRELHIDFALDAINYNSSKQEILNVSKSIVARQALTESMYFVTNKLNINRIAEIDYSGVDSFVIYLCTKGKADVIYKAQAYSICCGEILLLPAITQSVNIKTDDKVEILEIYFPD